MTAAQDSRRGSHADRRAATRRRLLDAAIECLVELGYARTTTLEVQARAGVSRGALLHHFANRDELFLAAIDHLLMLRMATVHDELLRIPRSADRVDASIEVMARVLNAPETIAAIELWNASRTDPELAGAVRQAEAAIAAQLAKLATQLVGPEIAEQPMFPAVYETLFQAIVGASLGQHLRPARWHDQQKEHWKQIVRVMLERRG
jgi:AcrR family transcriptional regulator